MRTALLHAIEAQILALDLALAELLTDADAGNLVACALVAESRARLLSLLAKVRGLVKVLGVE